MRTLAIASQKGGEGKPTTWPGGTGHVVGSFLFGL